MSSLGGCDSDEEVFWGPVTAKEIELLWRHRTASQTESHGFDSEETGTNGELKVEESCDNKNIPLEKHGNVQEVPIQNQNESVPSSEIAVNPVSINCDNDTESSDEKSFVSLTDEGDNCISSLKQLLNDQPISFNQDPSLSVNVKNKENEDPSESLKKNESKIPSKNISKLPVLKPAKLQLVPGLNDVKWANDLKQKKIPKPRKPEYMVSPAKLGNILRNCSQSTTKIHKTPLASVPSISNMKFETPVSKFSSPVKKQFEYVKSPVSQYIRTGTGITQAKSLPVLGTPNKIPVPVSVKQTPVRELTPKFYSSAEKLIIKPGPSSLIPKSEAKKGKTFVTPKIFKHKGRVPDDKNPGEISVVTPRAVRTTNLLEASFVSLSQPLKQLNNNVSVIEEQ